MSVSEVAERIGLSEQTVRLKIRNGELPGFRLGRRGSSLRVSRQELEDWLFEEQVVSADVLAACERERAAAVEVLEALRALDPSTQFVVPSGLSAKLGPALMLGPSAADLVAGAEDHVAHIDAEIDRMKAAQK